MAVRWLCSWGNGDGTFQAAVNYAFRRYQALGSRW